ncbi:MAG: thioredoxin domain-containing protein [Myxococcales bacterium]|nr:thioredoxin domain-containing protein [Myxococcales bacterium]
MAQNSSASLVVSAVVLAVALIASALVVRGPLAEGVEELARLNEGIGKLQVAARPTPAPAQEARAGRPDPNRRYAVSTNGSPSKGSPEAQIALVEFSDFQCPFCGRVTPTLRQIEREYGDRVRIVFKHLPLRMHSKAPAAHAAAEAAHRQGKFWEMHDLIFANQREMSEAKYVEYAEQIGIDVDRFNRDVVSADVKAKVDADAAEAEKLGVTGTPGFFVNGRFLSGAQPFSAFKTVIDRELGAS